MANTVRRGVKRRLLRLPPVAAAGLLLFTPAGVCGGGEPLRVSFGNAPPFTVIGPEGTAQGFAVDALEEAANRTGLTLAWQLGGTPEANNESLRRGKLDLIIGPATPERRKSFYVSEPWWSSWLVAIVPAASPYRQDADLRGLRLAVAPGLAEVVSQEFSTKNLEPGLNAVAVAEAACSGAADAGIFADMYLRELLFAGSSVCRGVSLRVIDTGARLDYVLVSRPETATAVRALKDALDEITADGSLASIAARHPPVSQPQATRLAEMLRIRYERRVWRIGLTALALVVVLGGLFIFVQQASRRRLRQANQRLAQDLAARTRAEAALRESEARVRALLDSAPQPVLAVNAAGTVAFANAKTEAMFGYRPEDLTGRDVTLVLPAHVSGHSPSAGNQVGVRKDGSRFPVEVAAGSEESAPHLTILFVADVSERMALEERVREAQKMDSIGLLAGGLAHEFNNLLTVIEGYAQLLLAGCSPTDRSAKPAEKIALAASRAATLTRQLLTFSHRQLAAPRTMGLNDLLGHVQSLFRPLIRENIALSVDLRAQPQWIYADPALVEQVVMNLVVNARDAMPNGGRLTITTLTPASGEGVALRVSDTGIGMTPELKTRIFEPFFTTKPPGKGTGLGLSVVYGIVRQSGAAISVQSEPGQGTVFEIVFPASGPPPPPQSAGGLEPSATEAQGQETILVAEDERDVRDFICEVLRSHGYTVLAAANGREALERITEAATPIHLLLTDSIMPEMGGADLSKHFAARFPGTPVLRISGYADSDTLADETTPMLAKPFTGPELLRRVRQVLDG